MNRPNDPDNLQELIARIRDHTREMDEVSVGDLLSAAGERSFGPVVLVAGLITLAPLIGDIPGVPTLLGLLVLLTLGQLLFQRESIWIPTRLSERRISREKLFKGLDWMDRPARKLDDWTRRHSVVITGLSPIDTITLTCPCWENCYYRDRLSFGAPSQEHFFR